MDPGLHIEGVGPTSLPLRIHDADAIKRIGTQAPFGRGSETIVDTSFSNTIELDANHFELQNPAWSAELTAIVSELCRELGCDDSPRGIKAELYKMLLYEQGAMFKPHTE